MLNEAESALGRQDLSAGAHMARLAGKISAIRASLASWRNARETIALSLGALDLLSDDDLIWRAVVLTNLGMAHALRGEVVAACRALAEATDLSPADASYYTLGARMWLGHMYVVQGKLTQAAALYRQGIEQVSQHGAETLPIASNFFAALGGSVDYERNDLESAERHLLEGIRLAGRQQWPWVLADAYAILARIKRSRGAGDAARDLLWRMEQYAQAVDIPWPWMKPRLAASVAHAYIAFGQVERAAEWAARCHVSEDDDLHLMTEFQRIIVARVLIAQHSPVRALRELDGLLPDAEAQERWGRVIEIQALRAMALEQMAKRQAALDALGRALALAEPEGYVRRFVDEGPTMKLLLGAALARGIAPAYVTTLVDAFGDTPPGPKQLDEPLSIREREVLRLLVAGRSGPEIADALVVAPSTIKTHLKNIYETLGVHSRDQAIARVRELKLP